MLPESLFAPVLSPILRDRKLVFAVLGAAVLQLGLVTLRLPGWPCPFIHALGVPCPGCGLTRATLLLLRGDWRASLSFHAFAPLLVLALVLVTCSATLPEFFRQRIISRLDEVERHTGFSTMLLFGLIIYWLARVLIMRSAFAQFIQQ
jgi:hypothetical protein